MKPVEVVAFLRADGWPDLADFMEEEMSKSVDVKIKVDSRPLRISLRWVGWGLRISNRLARIEMRMRGIKPARLSVAREKEEK